MADERGVALPLALVVLLILAALAVALADMTAAELDMGRWARWDVQSHYLAQAGMEHQIYALKANKDAAAVGAVNYPATADQEYWYTTTVACLLQCAADRESRRWRIVSRGEIRQTGGGPTLQSRAIRADVEIAYAWDAGTGTFRLPTAVTILRWEEVYP
jgi:Tfp pilus assembly protein PilV